MKNVTLNLLVLSFLICSGTLYAQDKKANQRINPPSPTGIYRCVSDEYNAKLLQKNPNMMGSPAFEKKLKQIIAERKLARIQSASGTTLVRIPVVVHVIHNGSSVGIEANISDAQILSQIQVLNEDFRKMANTNGDNSNPVGADTMIEFYLAKETPDGCTTTGIERYNLSSIATSWDIQGNTDNILKPMTIWDSSRYLNMWTVTFSDTTYLGYGQFPGGPADTDGVVMDYHYFGSNDAPGVNLDSSAPYDLGRTTTHEVGHFLGLWHIFEDGCADGDFCDDTPATAQENYNCPKGQDSCPVGQGDGILDMVENYMDYTDDACMNIFTMDQSLRMDGVLSIDRLSLTNSTVPDVIPPVSYDASIKIMDLNLDPCTVSFTPEIKLANFGTSTLTEANISYNINGGTPIVIIWSGSLVEGDSEIINLSNMSTPIGSNTFNISVSQNNADQRPCNDTDSESFDGVNYASALTINLTLNTDSYAKETSWEFKDSNNTILDGYSYNPSDNNKTFDYSFDVIPNECYTFTIFDSFGDGLCCANNNGEGSYELRTDNNTIITNYTGDFGSERSTTISTTTLGISNYFVTNKFSLFPNPTSADLKIKVRTINDLPDSILVFNMLGQTMISKKVSTTEDLNINTSHFSEGMYFVKIVKDNASVALPFIKK